MELVLNILIILIGLYLAFIKSYFKEKGKNVATSQDIEKITLKIEHVKSDVGILMHRRINLFDEKQNSLLDYNSKYAAWLNYILNASIFEDSETADLYFEKAYEKQNTLFHDLSIAEAKLNIYFYADTELIDLKNKLKIETIKLANYFNLNLVKGKTEIKLVYNILSIPDSIPDNSNKLEKLKKQLAERNKFHEEYQKQKLVIYNPIALLNHSFSEMLYKRLNDFEEG